MVAKGKYTDLQRSGVDFTSLLKEEEEQQQPPQDIQVRSRTLSQNSVLSQTSSVHSAKDGDQLPVSSRTLLPLPWLRCHQGEIKCSIFTPLFSTSVPLFFSQAEPVHTMAEESRAQGTIGVSLYVKYLRAGANVVFLLLVILINLLAQVVKHFLHELNICLSALLLMLRLLQVAYIMQDWWLAYW